MADGWMPWLVLIADDLTGANDSGGQMARYGLPTVTYLDVPPPGAPLPPAAAVLFNSDSRHLSPAQAYSRLKELSSRLPAGRHLYKKVDSLLRGHLGQELDALLDEGRGSYALIAPAFPAQHRTTRGGVQTVHGEPVHLHPAVRASVNAPSTSHLGELLKEQSRRTCRLIPLDTVRQGPQAVQATLATSRREGASLIVADAETEEDLSCLVQAGLNYRQASGEKPIWTGSAGLAGALARHLATSEPLPSAFEEPHSSLNSKGYPLGGLLLVCGTRSPVTLVQIAALDSRPVTRLSFSARDLAGWANLPEANGAPPSAALQDGLARAQHLLANQHDVLLMVEGDRPEGSTNLDPLAIVSGLAQMVERIMEAARPGALFLSGGDTAQSVLNRLGVSALWVVAEILPGIPLCRAVDGPWRGLPVVTKSGGFGDPDALVRVVDYLREGPPHPPAS